MSKGLDAELILFFKIVTLFLLVIVLVVLVYCARVLANVQKLLRKLDHAEEVSKQYFQQTNGVFISRINALEDKMFASAVSKPVRQLSEGVHKLSKQFLALESKLSATQDEGVLNTGGGLNTGERRNSGSEPRERCNSGASDTEDGRWSVAGSGSFSSDNGSERHCHNPTHSSKKVVMRRWASERNMETMRLD